MGKGECGRAAERAGRLSSEAAAGKARVSRAALLLRAQRHCMRSKRRQCQAPAPSTFNQPAPAPSVSQGAPVAWVEGPEAEQPSLAPQPALWMVASARSAARSSQAGTGRHPIAGGGAAAARRRPCRPCRPPLSRQPRQWQIESSRCPWSCAAARGPPGQRVQLPETDAPSRATTSGSAAKRRWAGSCRQGCCRG